MQSEVVRMMGWPIIPGATQLSPPNHQVALLNWFGLMNMLAEQTSAKQDMFSRTPITGYSWCSGNQCTLPPQPTSERLWPVVARDWGQFTFGTDPVVAWEGAFQKLKGGSDVKLLAVVDNRVFPRLWQWPVTLSDIAQWWWKLPMVHTPDWPRLSPRTPGISCWSGYTVLTADTESLASLPAQWALLMQHIIVVEELGKPLVLPLRAGTGHPISDIIREALMIVRTANIVPCYTGDLASNQHWVGRFPNSVFGIVGAGPGFDEVAHCIDFTWLVLETDSPMLAPMDLMVGTPMRWCHAQQIAVHHNPPSWVVLGIATFKAQALYQV